LLSQATSGFSAAPGSNQPSGAGDFIGWSSLVYMPLEIRTDEGINPQQINCSHKK
jgi:hypothetical protein